VRVVKGDGLETPFWETIQDDDRIVVFEESNENAARRIEELRRWEAAQGHEALKIGEVLHVNCGLLPSSEASWRMAWMLLSRRRDGWLHLHENVGVADIDSRRQEIQRKVETWASEDHSRLSATVEHVELVKTFAPGVWHCVFDVYVEPSEVEKPKDKE